MAGEDLTAEYDRFETGGDFAHFQRLVSASPDFEEVPVRAPYSNDLGFVERWYRHGATQRMYRLVEPDGPFRGLWQIVR